MVPRDQPRNRPVEHLLGEADGEMDYAAVGEAVRRLRKRLKEDRFIGKVYKHAAKYCKAG